MKQLKPELEKSGYKYFKPNLIHRYSKWFYQKKIWDYFINCIVYDNYWNWDNYEFEVQFDKDEKAINIQTVQWFNDTHEQFRKYPTLKEVENLIEWLYNFYINFKLIWNQ